DEQRALEVADDLFAGRRLLWAVGEQRTARQEQAGEAALVDVVVQEDRQVTARLCDGAGDRLLLALAVLRDERPQALHTDFLQARLNRDDSEDQRHENSGAECRR